MYRLTVDQPGSPKGTKVLVNGLAEVEVGVPYEVTDDEADRFRHVHGRVVPEGEEGAGSFVPGPTLLEAFKGVSWVKVEAVKTATATVTKTEGGEK